jgi:hypothetical protein
MIECLNASTRVEEEEEKAKKFPFSYFNNLITLLGALAADLEHVLMNRQQLELVCKHDTKSKERKRKKK